MPALSPSLRGRFAKALFVCISSLFAAACGSDNGSNSHVDLEWANWPLAADSPAASGYRLTTDTATDAVTGLVWQRNAPATTYSWADATAYCDGLSLGGNSDWHLPTLIELESIVHYGKLNPAIDTTIFPGPRRPACS